MKKAMSRLIALALILMLTLGMSALAAETASEPYRVPGVTQRPQGEEKQEPEQPAQGGEVSSAPVEGSGETPEEPEEGEPETPEAPEQGEPLPPEEEQPEPEQPAGRKVVTGGTVNVRAEASGGAKILGQVQAGDVVEVLAEQGAWTKIRTAGGLEGFMASKYLAEVAEPAQPEATEQPAEPEAAGQPEQPVVTDEPVAEPEVPSYNYERAEDGSLLLDENGNPIVVLPEGAEIKPVAFQRDADGNLILDENGNPIPVQFLPVEAEKIDTIEDELDPNRTIDVYAAWDSDQPKEGDTMRLYAVLNGYGNMVYTLQWQDSVDGENWRNIPDATEDMYSVVVTSENYLYYWRVEVIITDVIDENA